MYLLFFVIICNECTDARIDIVIEIHNKYSHINVDTPISTTKRITVLFSLNTNSENRYSSCFSQLRGYFSVEQSNAFTNCRGFRTFAILDASSCISLK